MTAVGEELPFIWMTSTTSDKTTDITEHAPISL
jgi:hypothetical protein